MNILLVNSPSKPEEVQAGENNMYPLSLLFLSSFLCKNGYRAKILDLSTSMEPRVEFSRYLRAKGADIIGFTATTENRFLVLDLITDSKKVLTKAKIVVGGNHFTYTAQQALEVIPEIDVVVRGEGEITFLELVKAYEGKEDITNILGISYRENNKIIHNLDRPFEKDIDKFVIQEEVFEDAILPYGNYSPFMRMRNYYWKDVKTLSIHAGRGCPGKCVYCLYNKKQYRTRSVDSVIREIKIKREKYRCSAFHLQDPHLLKRQEFVQDFCGRLLKEDIKIEWYAETRADIDIGVLDIMKESGCISLDFGLESASEKVLKSIKKGIRLEQAEKLIKRCAKLGIRIKVFTMISHPDEKEEDALKTLRFLNAFRRNITSYSGAVTRIYPGSELEAMAKKRGIISENFQWYDRNYQNGMQDLVQGCVPVWIEYLSPNFIRFCKKEIDRISLLGKPILKSILERLKPFVFKWSVEDIKMKWRLIRRLFKALYYRIVYKFR
ncbi:MAG: B12-binding domain-containing radical SAM protein [Candidatus Omnitrophica bacterium]|nr:B12-binding domain-containing radical SAM protein [Candidatus Omnitrophota bacterium]